MKQKSLKTFTRKFLSFMLMAVMLSSNVLPALAQTSVGTFNLNLEIDKRLTQGNLSIYLRNRGIDNPTTYGSMFYKLAIIPYDGDYINNPSTSHAQMNQLVNDQYTRTTRTSAYANVMSFAIGKYPNPAFSKQLLCSYEDQYILARIGLNSKNTTTLAGVTATQKVLMEKFDSKSAPKDSRRYELCQDWGVDYETPTNTPTTNTVNQLDPRITNTNYIDPNIINPNLTTGINNNDDDDDDDDDRCRNFTMALPDDCYPDNNDDDDDDDNNRNQTNTTNTNLNPNLTRPNLTANLPLATNRVRFENAKVEFTSSDLANVKITADIVPVGGDYVKYDRVNFNYSFAGVPGSNMRSADSGLTKSALTTYPHQGRNVLTSERISVNASIPRLREDLLNQYCNYSELDDFKVRFALFDGTSQLAQHTLVEVNPPSLSARQNASVCTGETTNTTVNPGLVNYFPGLRMNLYVPTDYNTALDKNQKEPNRSKRDKNRKDLIDRLKNPKFPDFKYDLGDIDLTPSEEREVENERKYYVPNLDIQIKTPRDFVVALEEGKKETDTKKRRDIRDDLIDRLKNPKFPDFKYDLGDIDLTPSEEREVEEARTNAEPTTTTEERKNYKLPAPKFTYNERTGLIDVVLYAPNTRDFDEYIFDVSRDSEFSQVHYDSDGEVVKNNGQDKQRTTSQFDKEILCKDYTTTVYGSAAIRIDGKHDEYSQSENDKFKVPALTSRSADARKKMCGFKETTTVTDTVDQDTTSPESENRYAPEVELTKKVKVKFDVDAKAPITGKDAGVLRPSLNWAFDITRDLVALLPNMDKDQQENLYDKTIKSRDDLVDKIKEAYPGQWPGFKKIFVDLRESVDVTADATPDEANGVDLDDAANGLFDVSFDYTLLLTLAKKVNWNEIPTYTPAVIDEVEEQEQEAETQIEEEADTPVETLTTIADIELPVLPELTIAIDIDDVVYDEQETVPAEQEAVIDEIESEVDDALVTDINNLWDYNYEYEVPEFDFTVCQRSYDPVADGTFNDLAYDANDISSLAAHCLKANNIIGGYTDGTFRADQEVNRAEAAKFLMVSKFMNIQSVMDEFNMQSFVEKFPDVPAGQWYTEFVTVANRTGVINGYQDGTYKPANTVSTGEFFKMLLSANPTGLSTSQINFLKSQEQTIVPTDGSVWGPEFFYVVEKFNLLESRPGSQTSVDFNAPMTRGEVAVAIFKFLRDVTPDSDVLN